MPDRDEIGTEVNLGSREPELAPEVSERKFKYNPTEESARTEVAQDFITGRVRVDYIPSKPAYPSTKDLYKETLTGSTKQKDLLAAAGITSGETFTNYYNRTGVIPKGYEIAAKLQMKEDKVATDYLEVKSGAKSYQDFLYDNYGKDILRSEGHEFDNPLYWYNRAKQGVYTDPLDDANLLNTVLYRAEQAFELTNVYKMLGGSFNDSLASKIVGQKIDGATMAQFYGGYGELAEAAGGWEELLTKYRGGMVSGFDPIIYDDDGKAVMYLARTGKLYRVADAGTEEASSKGVASAFYNKDGTLDRISVNESQFTDGFFSLTSGVVGGTVNMFLDILGLGWASLNAISGGKDGFTDTFTEYSAWKNSWGAGLSESGVHQVQSEWETDDIVFGALNAVGTVAGMVLMMTVTGGLAGMGDKIVQKTVDTGVKSTIKKKVVQGAQAFLKLPSRMVAFNGGGTISKGAAWSLNRYANVMEKAAINFLVDGLEVGATLTAKQWETGQDTAEIWGKAALNGVISSGLTIFLSGGTNDKGAALRWMNIDPTKMKGVTDHTIDGMAKALTSSKMGQFILKHNRGISLVADVLENATVMGMKQNLMATGDIGLGKDLLSPEFVAMQAVMGIGAWRGMTKSAEGVKSLGTMNDVQLINKIYDSYIRDLDMRIEGLDKSSPDYHINFNQLKKIKDDFYNNYAKNFNALVETSEPGVAEARAMLQTLDQVNDEYVKAGFGNNLVIYDGAKKEIELNKVETFLAREQFVYAYIDEIAQTKRNSYKEVLGEGTKGLYSRFYKWAKGTDSLKGVARAIQNGMAGSVQDVKTYLENMDDAYQPEINLSINSFKNSLIGLDLKNDIEADRIEINSVESFITKGKEIELVVDENGESTLMEKKVIGKKGKSDTKKRVSFLDQEETNKIVTHLDGDKLMIEEAIKNGIVVQINHNEGQTGEAAMGNAPKYNQALQEYVKHFNDGGRLIDLGSGRYFVILDGKLPTSDFSVVDYVNKYLLASLTLSQSTDVKEMTKAIQVLGAILKGEVPGNPVANAELQTEVIVQLYDEGRGSLSLRKIAAIAEANPNTIKKQLISRSNIDVENNKGLGKGLTIISKYINAFENVKKFEELSKIHPDNQKNTDVREMLKAADEITADQETFVRLVKDGIISHVEFLKVYNSLKEAVEANPMDPLGYLKSKTKSQESRSGTNLGRRRRTVEISKKLEEEIFQKFNSSFNRTIHSSFDRLSDWRTLGESYDKYKWMIHEQFWLGGSELIQESHAKTGRKQWKDKFKNQWIGEVRRQNVMDLLLKEETFDLVKGKTPQRAKEILINKYKDLTNEDKIRFNLFESEIVESKKSDTGMNTVRRVLPNSEIIEGIEKAFDSLDEFTTIYNNREVKKLLIGGLKETIRQDFGVESKDFLMERIVGEVKRLGDGKKIHQSDIKKIVKNAAKEFNKLIGFKEASNEVAKLYYNGTKRIKGKNVVTVNLNRLTPIAQIEYDSKVINLLSADVTKIDSLDKITSNMSVSQTEFLRQLKRQRYYQTLYSDNPILSFNLDIANDRLLLKTILNDFGYDEVEINAYNKSKINGITFNKSDTVGFTIKVNDGVDFADQLRLTTAKEVYKFNEDKALLLYNMYGLYADATADSEFVPGEINLKVVDTENIIDAISAINEIETLYLYNKAGKIARTGGDHRRTIGFVKPAVRFELGPEMQLLRDILIIKEYQEAAFQIYSKEAKKKNRDFGLSTVLTTDNFDPSKITKLEKFGWEITKDKTKDGIYYITGFELKENLDYSEFQNIDDFIPGMFVKNDNNTLTINMDSEEYGGRHTSSGVNPMDLAIMKVFGGDHYKPLVQAIRAASAQGPGEKIKFLNFPTSKSGAEVKVSFSFEPLDTSGGKFKGSYKKVLSDINKVLSKPGPKNAYALILKNQIEAAIALSEYVNQDLKTIYEGDEESYNREVKIRKVLSEKSVANELGRHFDSGASDEDISRKINIYLKNLPVKEEEQLSFKQKGVIYSPSSDELKAHTMTDASGIYTSADIISLNKVMDISGFELTADDIASIRTRMESTLLYLDNDVEIFKNNKISNFVGLLSENEDGDYDLTMDAFLQLDPTELEDPELRDFIIDTFGENTYEVLREKAIGVAKLFPNKYLYENKKISKRKLKVQEVKAKKKTVPTPAFEINSDSPHRPSKARADLKRNQLANRALREENYNMLNRNIKASDTLTKQSQTGNMLYEIMLNNLDEEYDMSATLTHPSSYMITNMENRLSKGKLINDLSTLTNIIQENGLGDGVNSFKFDNEQSFELAYMMYRMSTGVDYQSEYSKYLFITKKADGTYKYDTAQMHRDRGEESVDSFIRTFLKLDPEEETIVMVMDKNIFEETSKLDDGTIAPDIRYVDLRNKEQNQELINSLITQRLLQYTNRDINNLKGLSNTDTKKLLAEALSKTVTSYETQKIQRNELKNMFNETFFDDKDEATANKLAGLVFQRFSDLQVASADNTLSEETFYGSMGLIPNIDDTGTNSFINRVNSILQTSLTDEQIPYEVKEKILNKLSRKLDRKTNAYKYVSELLKGVKQRIKPEKVNPELFADILRNFMLRSNSMLGKDFILKQISDSKHTLENVHKSWKETNPINVKYGKNKDKILNLKNLEGKKIIAADTEIIFRNDNTMKTMEQFGARVFEFKDGEWKETSSINLKKQIGKELINSIGSASDINNEKGLAKYIEWVKKAKNLDADAIIKELQSEGRISDVAFKEALAQFIMKNSGDDTVFLFHNGHEADMGWLMSELGDSVEGLKAFDTLEDHYIDTLKDVIEAFPINDMNSEELFYRKNMDDLIRTLNIDEATRARLMEDSHDASKDALRLFYVFKLAAEKSFDTNKFNNSIINVVEKLADDLGVKLTDDFIKKVSDELKFERPKLETEEASKWLDDYKNRKGLDSEQVKKVVDIIKSNQLVKERIFKYKQLSEEYNSLLYGYNKRFVESLEGEGRNNLADVTGFLVNKFGGSKEFEESSIVNVFSTQSVMFAIKKAFPDYIVTYENGNVSLTREGTAYLLTTIARSPENFIKLLSASNPGLMNYKEFEEFKEGFDRKTFLDSVNKFRASDDFSNVKEESDKTYSFNRYRATVRPLIDNVTKSFSKFDTGVYESILEDMGNLIGYNRERIAGTTEVSTEDRAREILRNKRLSSQLIDQVREELKENPFIKKITKERYYEFVTPANVEEGIVKVNKTTFETIFGADEKIIRERLGYKKNKGLFISLIRQPGDKVDPIHQYKIMIDYNDKSTNFKIGMNPIDLYSRHSGDFDGDSVIVYKPSNMLQHYMNEVYDGETVFEKINKPYKLLNSLLAEILKIDDRFDPYETGSFKKRALLESVQRMVDKEFIKNSLTRLENSKDPEATYKDLLNHVNLEVANALINEKIDLDLYGLKLKKGKFTEESLEIIKDEITKKAFIEIHNFEDAQTNKWRYTVNNRLALDDPEIKKIHEDGLTNLVARDSMYQKDTADRDASTGVQDKDLMKKIKPETRPFKDSAPQYKVIGIPNQMLEALGRRFEFETNIEFHNNLKNTMKDLFIKNGLNPEIIDGVIGERFTVSSFMNAIGIAEQQIRSSEGFLNAIEDSFKKFSSGDLGLYEHVQAIKDLSQALLGEETFMEPWVQTNKSSRELDSFLTSRVKQLEEESGSAISFESEEDMQAKFLANQKPSYVLIDNRANVKEEGFLLMPAYKNSRESKLSVYYRDQKGNIHKDNVDISSNTKFMGVGTGSFVKGTIYEDDAKIPYKVTGDQTYTTSDGTEIKGDQISFVVTEDHLRKLEAYGKGKAVTIEIDGKKVEAIEMLITISKDTSTWNKYKDTELDVLVVKNASETIGGMLELDGRWFELDENGDVIYDSRDAVWFNRRSEQLKSPTHFETDGYNLYTKLRLMALLELTDREKLPDGKRAMYDSVLKVIESDNNFTQEAEGQIFKLMEMFFGSANNFYKEIEGNKFFTNLFSRELNSRLYDDDIKTTSFDPDDVDGKYAKSNKGNPHLYENTKGERKSAEEKRDNFWFDNSSGIRPVNTTTIQKRELINYLLAGNFVDTPISKSFAINATRNGTLGLVPMQRLKFAGGFKAYETSKLVEDSKYAIKNPLQVNEKAGNRAFETAVATNRPVDIIGNQNYYRPSEGRKINKTEDKKIDKTSSNSSQEPTQEKPTHESFASRFKRTYKLNLNDKEYKYSPSSSGTDKIDKGPNSQQRNLILYLTTGLAKTDKYDRAELLAPTGTNKYSVEVNPKEVAATDQGLQLRANTAAPQIVTTLSEARKRIDYSLGSNDYKKVEDGFNTEISNQIKGRGIDLNERMMDDRSIVKDLPTDQDFRDVTQSRYMIARNLINDPKYDAEIPEAKYHKDLTDGDISQRIYKNDFLGDLLSTTGMYGATPEDQRTIEGIQMFYRQSMFKYAELTEGIRYIGKKLVTPEQIQSFNKYASVKAIIDGIKHYSKSEADTKDVLNNYGFNNLREANDFVAEYENLHKLETNIFRKAVNDIIRSGLEVSASSNQPSLNMFNVLFPVAKFSGGDTKRVKRWVLKGMFNYNADNVKFKDIISGVEFDFMNSLDTIADNVAKLGGAVNMSKAFKKNGDLVNRSVVAKVTDLFEDRLDQIDDSVFENPKIFRTMEDFTLRTIEDRVADFYLDDIDHSESKSLYAGSYRRLVDIRTEKARELGVVYSTLNELYEAKRLGKFDDYHIDQLIEIEKSLDDIRYEVLALDSNLAESILSSMNLMLGEDKVFVNEFGQMIKSRKEDGGFYFKPLANMDFSYIGRNITFAEGGDSFAQRMAVAGLKGDIYVMNKSLANLLDSKFFTAKVNSKIKNTLLNVVNNATKLIMSSVPKLASRLFNYSLSDLGMIMAAHPGSLLEVGSAMKELSAFYQSKGAVINKPEFKMLKEFLTRTGMNPEAHKGYDVDTFTKKIESPEILEGYYDMTDKAFQYQTLALRYALFRSVVKSFDEGKPFYGPTYVRKEAIDGLDSNYAKALEISDEVLGGPGGFPIVARKLSGVFMFTTFPLALARMTVQGGRSAYRLFGELLKGQLDSDGTRQLIGTTASLAGQALLLQLLIKAVASIYDVDEETEEEWQEEAVLFDPVLTLFNGSPVISYGVTADVFKNIKDVFVDPFKEDGIKGMFNSTVTSKLNPVFKTPLELIQKKDYIGASTVDTSEYEPLQNLLRKATGYIIGNSGANAMMKQWNYSALAEEDPNIVTRVGKSMKAALGAEIGNTKKYKADRKNYYTSLQMVRGFRKLETEGMEYENEGGFNSEAAYQLSKKMSKALTDKQPVSVVYYYIDEAIKGGINKEELLYALTMNSIAYKLGKIRDKDTFYGSLSGKEQAILKDGLTFEKENFSILEELANQLKQEINEENYKPYIPKYYWRTIYDDYKKYKLKDNYNDQYKNSKNKYNNYGYNNNYYNNKNYKDSYKKYDKNDPLTNKTFVPSLTKHTGKYAKKLPKGQDMKIYDKKHRFNNKKIKRKAKDKTEFINHNYDWKE